jgi:hypothetical protein
MPILKESFGSSQFRTWRLSTDQAVAVLWINGYRFVISPEQF